MYSETFQKIIGKHKQTEGGWVNHPNDPGAETYKGIARRYNEGWSGWIRIDRLKDHPQFPEILEQDALLQGLVDELYYWNYWNPMNLDLINNIDVVAELFDQGGGPQGIHATQLIAQGACVLSGYHLKLDAKIGPVTAKALNEYHDRDFLVKLLNCLQFVHFLIGSGNMREFIEMVKPRLNLLRTFIRGWTKHRIRL